MKSKFIILIIILLTLNISWSNKIIYTEPAPGAKYVSVQNNIIIGFDTGLNISEKEANDCVKVTGSVSLSHNGKLIITNDYKKIIFIPETNFSPGETVTVSFCGKLSNLISGRKIYRYSFFTANSVNTDKPEINKFVNTSYILPPVLPEMTVTVNNNPEDGFLFLSNFSPYFNYTPYLIITDKNSIPYYYKMMDNQAMDFKKQNNGNLTYYDDRFAKFYELSVNYDPVDSFYCGNGYKTDAHDLQIISGRHALLLGMDRQVVDMSKIVPGGDTAATVLGLIIQEIDENKNVVFQWRSWDHFLITDAIHENLLAHYIDYVHGNAIELDNDGNLLLSSRHLEEITKISHSTGQIIWRLGGKNNQFTFINDTIRFSYQHAIRRISNGNITLYDNGNYHTPKFSRAVEYSLNETDKIAALVWEYRHTPAIYGSAMGNVQRLPGGNTLISWGTVNPTVTEVTQQGIIAFEMTLPEDVYSYRVFKFPWNGPPISAGNETGTIPKEYKLSHNYPNPFNPSTNISFDIPKASYVNITVYDILGRVINNIISGNYQPGKYQTTFDGTNFSSGLYFCVMKSETYFSVQKMLLAK